GAHHTHHEPVLLSLQSVSLTQNSLYRDRTRPLCPLVSRDTRLSTLNDVSDTRTSSMRVDEARSLQDELEDLSIINREVVLRIPTRANRTDVEVISSDVAHSLVQGYSLRVCEVLCLLRHRMLPSAMAICLQSPAYTGA